LARKKRGNAVFNLIMSNKRHREVIKCHLQHGVCGRLLSLVSLLAWVRGGSIIVGERRPVTTNNLTLVVYRATLFDFKMT
jgi:hypothetical protein